MYITIDLRCSSISFFFYFFLHKEYKANINEPRIDIWSRKLKYISNHLIFFVIIIKNLFYNTKFSIQIIVHLYAWLELCVPIMSRIMDCWHKMDYKN